jgi:uncharacterized protein YdbL (DUF1318 family)
MKQRNTLAILLMIFSLAVFCGMAWGQDIKERMRERLPVIVDLKARGIVGENNQGYLAHLKGQSEKKSVVDAENEDRKLVYQVIAKKQGIAADLVGQRRALQIAEKAKAGDWLQNDKGAWYQKK